ncbi:MAG: IPTL-CTERM sorting domain-containing protein, partial [Candidatus Nitrotoga sp.]
LASPTTQPPSVSKSFSPATVFAGGVSTLTITLGNSNASAVTLTADLVDNLPAGVTVNLATAASGSCTHAQVSMTATAVTYASGASIPAGGCTIIVAVTSSAIGSHLNTIPAGNLQTNAGNSASAATAPLTVNIVSVPTLSQWGMLLLAGLMVLVAFQSSRRPRSTT